MILDALGIAKRAQIRFDELADEQRRTAPVEPAAPHGRAPLARGVLERRRRALRDAAARAAAAGAGREADGRVGRHEALPEAPRPHDPAGAARGRAARARRLGRRRRVLRADPAARGPRGRHRRDPHRRHARVRRSARPDPDPRAAAWPAPRSSRIGSRSSSTRPRCSRPPASRGPRRERDDERGRAALLHLLPGRRVLRDRHPDRARDQPAGPDHAGARRARARCAG